MSAYTISPGIALEDGTILGRISDLELFDSFSIETDKMMVSPEIDGVDSVRHLFTKEQRQKMLSSNLDGKLWRIQRKGRQQIQAEQIAERRRNMKHRIEVYAEAQEFGILLPKESEDDE